MTKKTIVFSDVDGTLITSKHTVSEGTRDAILQLQKNDIPFVIVSGRGPTGIYPILEENNFNCAMISYSGSLILDEDRNVLYEKALPMKKIKEIVDFVESENMPLAWCIYPNGEWSVKDRTDPRIANEEKVLHIEAKEVKLEDFADDDKSNKMMCICDPGIIGEIEEKIRAKFTDCTVIKSSDTLLEIMCKGIDKAAAIDILCDMWGVKVEDTIAFGDNYNDLAMLKEVGHGFLMANAPDGMKAEIPNMTKDNDHDGIVYKLKELGLI